MIGQGGMECSSFEVISMIAVTEALLDERAQKIVAVVHPRMVIQYPVDPDHIPRFLYPINKPVIRHHEADPQPSANAGKSAS
jgi:hypothetical protein